LLWPARFGHERDLPVSRYRVLLTGHTFRRTAQVHEAALVAAGCEVIPSPHARPATEDELIPLVGNVDAVLASTDHFTRRVFVAAPRLKIVARWGVGFDAIDTEAAAEHGIWITTTPGTNEHSVADCALTMILALARDLVVHVETTRAGRWARQIGSELLDETLGIVGFGRIGRQVALRATPFGMRILAHDPVVPDEAIRAGGAEPVSLEALMRQSDYISLHAPSMPETTDLINARTLAWCKPTAFLINTARGDLVHEEDLAAALRSGAIAGAALDVFKVEPVAKGSPLLSIPNILPLPHIAGITRQSAERMSAACVENILAVLRGDRPPSPVNAPVAPRGHE
jgi:phosphoglycerate dehydrogenase-like enzyme